MPRTTPKDAHFKPESHSRRLPPGVLFPISTSPLLHPFKLQIDPTCDNSRPSLPLDTLKTDLFHLNRPRPPDPSLF